MSIFEIIVELFNPDQIGEIDFSDISKRYQ